MGMVGTVWNTRKKHSPSSSVTLSQTSLCFATKYFQSLGLLGCVQHFIHMVSMNVPSHKQKITLIDWRSEAAGELAIENVVNGQLQLNFVAHKKLSFRGYYRYISNSIRAKYYAWSTIGWIAKSLQKNIFHTKTEENANIASWYMITGGKKTCNNHGREPGKKRASLATGRKTAWLLRNHVRDFPPHSMQKILEVMC